jgi:hypothetical protein
LQNISENRKEENRNRGKTVHSSGIWYLASGIRYPVKS